MIASDLLEPFGDAELIPLVDVAERVGLKRGMQSVAVRHKVIVPAPKRGPHGRYLLTRDEALLILAAGLLADLLKTALVTVLQMLRGSGAQVSDSGSLVIPLIRTI